jgi:hypothetical protein
MKPFRPLPFPDQEHLVAVTDGAPGLGFPVLPFSPPDYVFVSANNQSFAATGIYRNQSYEMSGMNRPQRVSGARVSASLFQVLRVSPAMGRAFTQAEDEHAASRGAQRRLRSECVWHARECTRSHGPSRPDSVPGIAQSGLSNDESPYLAGRCRGVRCRRLKGHSTSLGKPLTDVRGSDRCCVNRAATAR